MWYLLDIREKKIQENRKDNKGPPPLWMRCCGCPGWIYTVPVSLIADRCTHTAATRIKFGARQEIYDNCERIATEERAHLSAAETYGCNFFFYYEKVWMGSRTIVVRVSPAQIVDTALKFCWPI